MICQCCGMGSNRVRTRTEFCILLDPSIALSMTSDCRSRRKWIAMVLCMSRYYSVWSEPNLSTLLQDNTSRDTGGDCVRRTCDLDSAGLHKRLLWASRWIRCSSVCSLFSTVADKGRLGAFQPPHPRCNYHQSIQKPSLINTQSP